MTIMKTPLADQVARDRIAGDLDATLIVEAAAGTGKTTELVGRILRALATGRARVDGIVAVTFTEKAAGELKLRLREALERARADAGGDDRTRLDEALATLEEARVSTIHGFCADLLRERPVEARVDPLFTVLTESQSERLYTEAFGAWLQERLEDPPEGVRRSLRRSVGRGFGSGDDDGPVDRLRRAGWSLVQWRDFPAEWRRPGLDRERAIEQLLDQLEAFAELSGQPSYRQDNLYLDTAAARRVAGEIARLRAFGETDYDGWEAALVDLCRDGFRSTRKGSGASYGAGVTRTAVLDARDALIEALKRFRELADADLAAVLHRDLLGSVRHYEELKARAGALDYLDLLLKARDLLRDDGNVRRKLQSDFECIFVDEFQDTDPLQAEILLLLAADGPAVSDWRQVRPVPGKLFIVGDPKQSIYRFRRADVGTYRQVCELLERRGAVRVNLTTSFRSRPAIQRLVNAAFEPLMTDDPQTLQPGYVRLSRYREERDDQPAVVALPVPRPYARVRVAASAIERSLPDAAGAFIDWLVNESGWTVAERRPAEAGGPDAAASVASAFRRKRPAGSDFRLKAEATSVKAEATRERATREMAAFRPADEPAPDDFRPASAMGFAPSDAEHRVRIQPRHICILFRRFVSFGEDMTRPYVDAIEARGIPHLLVGGRSFHGREEVEAIRAALAAVEWPDDELSVFATLRGPLFAIGDEELLEYRHRFGRLHPFRIPGEIDAGSAGQSNAGEAGAAGQERRTRKGPGTRNENQAPGTDLSAIGSALTLLRDLHIGRNRRPVADTVTRLLDATRAHVGFVLRPAGEQALANVLHVAELARQYELSGGISFRGFVEELQEAATREQAAEAPILEEGSDGVRLMTVHKAKGLEFPVVILADMTAKLRPNEAARWVDGERGVCALRIGGWSPVDLLEHNAEEAARETAEAVRLAYVAATRARDLLVVPGVGDGPWEGGWYEPLNAAIYPPVASRRSAAPASGCPPFRSKDSVLERPNGDPAGSGTVCPGLHESAGAQGSGPANPYSVVWWDPTLLSLDVEAPFGVRREDLIVKDVSPKVVNAGRQRYLDWRRRRDDDIAAGSQPTVVVRTVTESGARSTDPGAQPGESDRAADLPDVDIIELARDLNRPAGRRFGTLVHAILATVPLDADAAVVRGVASVEGRILGASDDEVACAADIVRAALDLPLLERARAAQARGRCRREVPLAWRGPDGSLTEGVIDLAFEEEVGWIVADFKTGGEIGAAGGRYRQQLRQYGGAIRALFGRPVGAVLVQV